MEQSFFYDYFNMPFGGLDFKHMLLKKSFIRGIIPFVIMTTLSIIMNYQGIDAGCKTDDKSITTLIFPTVYVEHRSWGFFCFLNLLTIVILFNDSPSDLRKGVQNLKSKSYN